MCLAVYPIWLNNKRNSNVDADVTPELFQYPRHYGITIALDESRDLINDIRAHRSYGSTYTSVKIYENT